MNARRRFLPLPGLLPGGPSLWLMLLMLAGSAPAPAAYVPGGATTGGAGDAIEIEVVPGDWGGVRPAQIRQLLVSVAHSFTAAAGLAEGEPIRIRVLPRDGSPRVLYERGDEGEYQVHLTAREARWYQYAYQFSHELCHILSHFDHKERNALNQVATGNQWFEESLCETASLFTLRRLAEDWARRPPSRNWLGYGPVFAEYADHLLAQPHRHPGERLDRWFALNREALRSTPYLRQRNEVVATRLLALFEQAPEQWRSITYLNRDAASAGKSFEAYLADWQAACPPPERRLVDRAGALLGIELAGAPADH